MLKNIKFNKKKLENKNFKYFNKNYIEQNQKFVENI